MDQREALEELDRLTQLLDHSDPAAIRPLSSLLEQRDRLVQTITTAAWPLDDAAKASLRNAWEAGDRLRKRMLVHRAATRDHLGRLYHSGCLLRALSTERTGQVHLDCVG